MKKRVLTAIISVGLLAGIGNVAQAKELDNIEGKEKNPVVRNNNVNGLLKSGDTAKVINVTTNLRIRKSPSTSSTVLGYLYGGDYVKVISKSGNWYEIEGKGVRGYVSAEYLQIVQGNDISDGKNGEVINVTTTLRLRREPSTSAAVIGSLTGGERFKILEKKNGWYKIDRDNQIGYIHGDYVKELSSTNPGGNTGGNNGGEQVKPENNEKICDGKVVNVTSSLRMRSDASTSASVVDTLGPNSKFEIYGQKNGWYKIKFNGKFGYVHGDYVQKLDGSTGGESVKPETDEKICDGKVVNVTSSLRMRSDASTSASVVATLYPGNTFEIYGQKNGWYKIKFSGKFGYVHGDYVQKLDGSEDSQGGEESKPGTNQSKYDTVLSEMKKHIGTPYVYGGAGEIISDSLIENLKRKFPGQQYNVPSQYRNGNYRAFDCSGLMQWGFKKAGINLGRTTYDQVKAGVGVSRSNVKPGDLVFYSDLNHVGMYVGNDQWIEAPRTGESLRITNIPWSKIGQIRRVL